jgi:hypothetical protein
MNDRKQKKRAAVPPEPQKPLVNCAFDELVPLEKLVPNPRNPNQHPQSQVALLAKVIAHQGWRSPVVVSTRSGFIVAGQGRYEAAKILVAAKPKANYLAVIECLLAHFAWAFAGGNGKRVACECVG